ncbi:catalase A [Paraconiothyrium brasiliense]|uniref:Catalase A n=1 Tax=Paraconiothyrium brasiliense TaxID=300254 RepID=A0ABR3RKV6_9PLEO
MACPNQRGGDEPIYTSAEGRPLHDPTTQLVLQGPKVRGGGLALLEDTQLIETLAHFPRERIPERVVHAKAAGAWGEFECTKDITDITSACIFSKVGKKTKALARISTTSGEKGFPDTVRDIRGFALKMFTEEGNYDFVGNDLPVFFIRDPIKFPSLNRSHKRHPQTNVPDASMFWDFHNNNQEVNGFGVHTFKFGKVDDGTSKYVKLHWKPEKIENLKTEEAGKLAGQEPDYHVKDLYNAIENGDYPVWTLNLQIMDPKEAETYRWNIFDDTKIWPHKDCPLIPVGKLTLNKNPENFFQDIEQAAFSPSNMIPGIGPTADLMLQARMFSYPAAARYRVGPNYQQLPCNKAQYVYNPYQRDGPSRYDGNYGADPDYVRSSFRKIKTIKPNDVTHDEWVGKVSNYTSNVEDDDWVQALDMWNLLKGSGDDELFISNLSGHVGKALPEVQKETIRMFAKVHKEIGERLEKALEKASENGPDHVKAPYGLQSAVGGGY